MILLNMFQDKSGPVTVSSSQGQPNRRGFLRSLGVGALLFPQLAKGYVANYARTELPPDYDNNTLNRQTAQSVSAGGYPVLPSYTRALSEDANTSQSSKDTNFSERIDLTTNVLTLLGLTSGAVFLSRDKIRAFFDRIRGIQSESLEVCCFMLERPLRDKDVVALRQVHLGEFGIDSIRRWDVDFVRNELEFARKRASANPRLPFTIFRRCSLANPAHPEHSLLRDIAVAGVREAKRTSVNDLSRLCAQSRQLLDQEIVADGELGRPYSPESGNIVPAETTLVVVPVHARTSDGRLSTRLIVTTSDQLAFILLAPGILIEAAKQSYFLKTKLWARPGDFDGLFEAAVALQTTPSIIEELWPDNPELQARIRENCRAFKPILVKSHTESLDFLNTISAECHKEGRFPQTELTPSEEKSFYSNWVLPSSWKGTIKRWLTIPFGPSIADAVAFINRPSIDSYLTGLKSRLCDNPKKLDQSICQLRADLLRSARVILRYQCETAAKIEQFDSEDTAERTLKAAAALISTLSGGGLSAEEYVRRIESYIARQPVSSDAATESTSLASKPLFKPFESIYRVLSFFGELSNPSAIKFLSRGRSTHRFTIDPKVSLTLNSEREQQGLPASWEGTVPTNLL